MRLFFIALFLPLTCCGDGSGFFPHDASQIVGFWRQEGSENTSYYFSNGYMRARVIDFGVQLVEKEYQYHTHADTVFLQDLFTGDSGKWVVRFENENRAAVVKVGAVSIPFTITKK